MDRPRRTEQVEVIETRVIEEGRRPVTQASYPLSSSTVRHSKETYEFKGDPFAERYETTGERDVSREPSFLHNSANYGQQIEISPVRPPPYNMNTSAHSNVSGPRVEFADTTANTVINNYGYDVHEVHTSGGGARIVETHGGGPIRNTNLESTRNEEKTPPRPSSLRSSQQVFSVSPPIIRNDSWKHVSDSESFVRKDSYRNMQTSDDFMNRSETSKSYAPQSQSSLVSRGTKNRETVGCWQRTKDHLTHLYDLIRTKNYTPGLLANLCCILLLLILLLILFGIILNAIFNVYGVSEFLLFPPVCEECRRKNPALVSAALPSSVFVHFFSSEQAHFELRGNIPFKSNSFTAIDFKTGYVAYVDHALTDANGRHTTCFLMPLDRGAIESIDQLSEAVSDSDYEEFWQFDPESIEPIRANSKFSEPIEDCVGAKWFLLKQTVHARDVDCSDCYDFCLPDWAVVRKEKYEDESTLGVRRLNCFRLYVPEWKNFRVEQDHSGGHWQYPLASASTKRDKSGEWVSWVPTGKAFARNRRQVTVV